MKEKLALLERVPEPAINRAAQTLLDLRETWENTTQEERRDLVHVMIQEVGIDMAAKCILWVKARPDYEPLFSILDGLRLDGERRYWIVRKEIDGNISDIGVDTGQMSTGVEILLPMSGDSKQKRLVNGSNERILGLINERGILPAQSFEAETQLRGGGYPRYAAFSFQGRLNGEKTSPCGRTGALKWPDEPFTQRAFQMKP